MDLNAPFPRKQRGFLGTVIKVVLFGGQVNPSFDLPLQSSLIPSRSTGSPTPTFTRATTAYQTDFEGKQNLVLSGEARMQGARRVDNLIRVSSNSTNLSTNWAIASSVVGATDPDGEATAYTITAGASPDYWYTNRTGRVVGEVFTFSVWIRRNTGTGTVTLLEPNFSGGGDVIVPTTSWQRFTIKSQTLTGTAWYAGIRLGISGDKLDIWHPLMEFVTGQANQAPSEYVSVGVLSTPYHGAGVDGVQYFSTLNGNTVTNNIVTEATGASIIAGQAGVAATAPVDAGGLFGYLAEGTRTNAILQSNTLGTTWTVSNAADMNVVAADAYVSVDGATTMDKLQPKATTAVHSLDQAFTFTAAQYTTSADLRYVAATPQRWVALICNDGTTTWGASFDLLNGVAGAVSAGATSTIEATALAGVYRCSVTNTANAAAAAGTVKISLNATDTATLESAARAGTETLGAGMVQHEIGTFKSSRIITTTVAVARNASVDQYVSAGNLNATAMTIALDWTPEAAAMGTIYMFGTYVDASNYTAILHDGTNVTARKRIAGTNHDATKALAYAAGTTYRIVGRFDSINGVDVWVAGAKGTGDATTTASQIGANFQVGSDGNSLQQAFGAIRNLVVKPKGLSDAQAAVL